jgi:hypothetical protein
MALSERELIGKVWERIARAASEPILCRPHPEGKFPSIDTTPKIYQLTFEPEEFQRLQPVVKQGVDRLNGDRATA